MQQLPRGLQKKEKGMKTDCLPEGGALQQSAMPQELSKEAPDRQVMPLPSFHYFNVGPQMPRTFPNNHIKDSKHAGSAVR